MPQPGKKGRDCVLCGCCLEGCPLLAATGREELSPRAKALLAGPSKFTAAALDENAVAELAGMCLACGRCEKLCPQGVQVPELIAGLRTAHPDFRQWLWKQWVTRLAPFWSVAAKGAGMLPQGALEKLAPQGFGLALKSLRGLAPAKALPRPWLTLTHLPVQEFRAKVGERPVALFHGCVGGGPRKAWAKTAQALLAGLGAATLALDFSCCGSTLGVAGLPAEQRTARLANVTAWRGAGRPLLVTYCATCRKGLGDYAGVFADEAEAELWRASVVPLAWLLLGARGKAGQGNSGRGAPTLVGWHKPCHAEAPGLGDTDFALLHSLLGTRLRAPKQSRCCGFGGIMQLSAPDLSRQVGQQCWEGLGAVTGIATGVVTGAMTGAMDVAQVVPGRILTGCSGCVMQLAALAPDGARVGHWLEVVRLDDRAAGPVAGGKV